MRDVDATDDPADDVVLARVASADLDALGLLYDRYASIAFGLAVRMTGDRSLAEDVVQEAFLGAWRHADRYAAQRGSVRTWLLAIVHHRAIDAVRRRRPTAELPDPDGPQPTAFAVPDMWPEVAGRLDGDRVRAALASINQDQREAIELAYFEGLTQQEIALRVRVPLGTVKGRVRLGLLALRRALVATEDSLDA